MALYSKLGSNLATDSPQKLSSLLSLFSSLGRRPCVSWLVETQRPTRTFPEGELFHSPGLPRQRLPGVPA
jgi:hypothetical protein